MWPPDYRSKTVCLSEDVEVHQVDSMKHHITAAFHMYLFTVQMYTASPHFAGVYPTQRHRSWLPADTAWVWQFSLAKTQQYVNTAIWLPTEGQFWQKQRYFLWCICAKAASTATHSQLLISSMMLLEHLGMT